jgi:cation diffusion facilitator CzcD-associated flavoprotein CzcO
MQTLELADFEKMEQFPSRVDAIVRDRERAEALKPYYRQFCKRPCFHDEYLQAFNRPNVHLIDTDGQGVERIDAAGVWVAGVHYPIDCLIFASGFEFATDYARRTGFDPVGRGGRTLAAHWADGMRTLHGMHVHGFPNLFVVGLGQNGNLISNITQNLDDIGRTIAVILRHALDAGVTEVEATEAAENAWVTLIESSPQGFLGNPECTPGYYNNEGGPIGRRERLNVSGYPMGAVAYFQYIDEWRRSGTFEGLAFRSAAPPAAVAS